MKRKLIISLMSFAVLHCSDDYQLRYLGEKENGSATQPPGSPAAPAVIGTLPADSAVSVATGTSVSVQFSAPMSTATITTNTVSTACTGSLQVSADAFATCVLMAANPSASNGNKNFSITPAAALSGLTAYQIRVTTAAQSAAANALGAAFTTTVGFTTLPDTTAPTVTFWIADGLTLAYKNMTHYFTFSEAMDLSTITTNTADTTCSGSLQISGDNFATCLQMTGAPTAAEGIVFGIKPILQLNNLASYRARVTTVTKDLAGNALASMFTMPIGFVTGISIDSVAPIVSSVNPPDGAAGVSVTTSIFITFDDNMQPITVTANKNDNTCSENVQMSSDGFVTCVAMGRQISSQLEEFTFTPLLPLAAATNYRVRVLSAAADKSGNTMLSSYSFVAGFTTGP